MNISKYSLLPVILTLVAVTACSEKKEAKMDDIAVSELVKTYGLQPHPEGGYYKETYRSRESIP